MNRNNQSTPVVPPLWRRLFSVWYRHKKIYFKNIWSNGLPPFLEPLIFLVGIGIGLGHYIHDMGGTSYLEFLATGLLVTSSMYTAAFECTFGTFIRMEFEKVYDGMLATPVTVENVIFAEILWAGSKGFFFSSAVLVVVVASGILTTPGIVLIPFVGLATGLMFGALGILVTSFIRNINHFNFFFTGFLSPMFFFSGVVFPVEKLPDIVRPFAEIFPLTHAVRLTRFLAFPQMEICLVCELAYMVGFTLIISWLGILFLKRRLVD